MTATTTLSVRALAYGGKFIGQHVGFARIDIYGPGDATKPLASGLTSQGLVAGTDGSGVNALIMQQPYPWGFPVRAEQATEFTAELALSEPTVLTFVATSVADPRISVTARRLVLPGVALTGAMAVVMVIPGLLVDLLLPTATGAVAVGTPTSITAQVRMMCGCLIDNLFWPVADFSVSAAISLAGTTVVVPLVYTGKPSFFAAAHTFTTPGPCEIAVTATEMNGNCGAAAAVAVTVSGG